MPDAILARHHYVYNVSGEFVAHLDELYDDPQWNLVRAVGSIKVPKRKRLSTWPRDPTLILATIITLSNVLPMLSSEKATVTFTLFRSIRSIGRLPPILIESVTDMGQSEYLCKEIVVDALTGASSSTAKNSSHKLYPESKVGRWGRWAMIDEQDVH